MWLYPQVNGEMEKIALLVPINLPIHLIQVMAAQITAVLIQAMADTVSTVVLTLEPPASIEMGKTAPPAASRHQTPITRVTAAPSNSCPYSGISGYCWNGSSYVGIPTGQYRSGENCASCTNKPANTYYTSAGGTSNNCAYSGNSGYCSNGAGYVSIPTGQYRSGENCATCTNAPGNTIQVTAAPATAVLTAAVTMVIVIVAAATPILLRDIIEAAKTA